MVAYKWSSHTSLLAWNNPGLRESSRQNINNAPFYFKTLFIWTTNSRVFLLVMHLETQMLWNPHRDDAILEYIHPLLLKCLTPTPILTTHHTKLSLPHTQHATINLPRLHYTYT